MRALQRRRRGLSTQHNRRDMRKFLLLFLPAIPASAQNTIRFADQFASIQNAINNLRAGGGTILIPPGVYAGPTTIPTGTNLWCLSGQLPTATINGLGGLVTYSATNTCVFQYTTSLTLSSLANVGFHWITFDFQNTVGTTNLTINSVSYSTFEIAVVNCTSTQPCLTLGTLNQANANTAENYFPRLILHGGSYGMYLAPSNTSGVTDNYFGDVQIIYPSSGGLVFLQNCDSNHFARVGIWIPGGISSFNGVTFNTASSSVDKDADDINIDWLDFTPGSVNLLGTAVYFNPSNGNFVRIGLGENAWQAGHQFYFATGYASTNRIEEMSPTGGGTNPPTSRFGNILAQSTTSIKRVQVNQGTAQTAGNIALGANWGTTASVSGVVGQDAAFAFTVTSSGTGQAANPTITVTFADV